MLGLITLASCSNDDSFETVSNDQEFETKMVTLNFNPYTMEAMTRGTTNDLRSSIDRLDIRISDMKNEVVHYITQTSDDENFGTVTVGIQKDSYYVQAVGYTGTTPVTWTGSNLDWGGNVPDVFYASTTFDYRDDNKTITLTRKTSKFKLRFLDDNLPGNVDKYVITFDKTGTVLKDGFCTTESRGVRTVEITASTIATQKEIDVLAFIPQVTDFKTNFNVKAIQVGGNILEERTFENVPLKVGYVTTYQGSMFSPYYSGFTWNINPDWMDNGTTSF